MQTLSRLARKELQCVFGGPTQKAPAFARASTDLLPDAAKRREGSKPKSPLEFYMQTEQSGESGFTAIPNWLFEKASPAEVSLLHAILQADGQCISVADLANLASVSRRTVTNTIKKMEDKGWLTKEATLSDDGGKGPNRYALTQRRVPNPARELKEQRPTRASQAWEKVVVPLELVATTTQKKAALFVYAYLQTFESPSICTLAAVAAMSCRDVRSSLRWLDDEGWIQKIERPGGTNQYRVFFERVGAFRG